MTRRSFVCPDPEDTHALGAAIGGLLRGGDVLCLSGPLGAGKTCLVQGIARGLGVDPSVPVTSPTFTLIGEYPGRIPLRHADFYRIESEQRLFEAGFDDLLDGRGAVVVEWGERWPKALPPDRVQIDLEVSDDGRRHVACTAGGQRAGQILEDLRFEGGA